MKLPRQLPRSPIASNPICLDCAKPMRLVSVVPHDRFKNLDVRNFECEVCRATASDVVARVG
jgi:hypothetical protein